MSNPKLFQPITIGDMHLKHRVVLAPLTRYRANDQHVPFPIVEEYYVQRGSVPGTLLITEATPVAAKAGGYRNVPGIWSDEHIRAWKKITDAVHAEGSFIFMQLWGMGRAAEANFLAEQGLDYVSSSSIALADRKDSPAPRPLSIPEIREYIELYGQAAYKAVHLAGFDGVEVHGANGYLVDQFLQDVSNHRTDDYGGSIEKRARFGLEVIDSIVKRVGARKAAIRLSPWTTIHSMGMADPIPTFSYFVKTLRKRHPELAYLHVVEPRVNGIAAVENIEGQSNDFIREIWAPKVFISAGGYDRNLAIQMADEKGDVIAFGRFFISNPDLPLRLKNDWPVEKGDRKDYYRPGSVDSDGYTSYPFFDLDVETSRL
ncbi:FMN-linked oxidoreductase [Pleurotus eryngii]|uniref:FMN-linked oxidoreductase n=1 Tax=Pleurotus eryngii TaxID=5323 RepID=A0A9P5ZKP7_PLEER|nr:FMN-linked oxidoreductase [Pleurotus eryngii]